MAFLQTSANDTDDLMSIITTFMASNGYTLIRSHVETVNTEDMTTTTMQCPDGTYITFISTNTAIRPYPSTGNSTADYYNYQFESTGTGTAEADFPAKNAFQGRYIEGLSGYSGVLADEERPWLGAIRHLTYDAGADWNQQPDAKRFFQTDVGGWAEAGNHNMYSAIVAGDNIPNVFIFINTNPDCIHIVTEYEGNKYSHMTIGNLEKSHTYVGGQYIVGSCNCLDSQADYKGYMPLNVGRTRAAGISSLCFGGVYCEGDGSAFYTGETIYGMKGWGRVHLTTGIHVYRGGGSTVNVGDTDFNYNIWNADRELQGLPLAQGAAPSSAGGYNWLSSTYDNVTGQAAPIPLTAWCEHESTGAVYLGSWEHVGVVMMGVLTGKEELTIGGDTYQVFPLNSLQPNGTDGMLQQGGDYDGGANFTDVTPFPSAHCYQLGLAIRKVV